MAVAIDEMSVEVAPLASSSAAHGAGSGAASPAGQPDSAALHKAMLVLNERKLRLQTN